MYLTDPSRRVGGSSLGLSICKSIVEAHGGHIELTSTPGQGTRVTFTVPLADSGSPANPPHGHLTR